MKANALIVSTLLAASLAGCSSTPKPQPAPPAPPPPRVVTRPAPPLPPLPAPPADWRDAPRSPGDWSWQSKAGRSVALYGAPRVPGSGAFALGCNPATRNFVIAVKPTAAPPSLITITTTSLRRALTVVREGAEVVTNLPADDPLIDAMAFSRGRFMVEMPGNAPLYLPSWPEISRVAEDCR
jgi:hypothetical protein